MAGRIVSAREKDGSLEVEFRRRGAKASQTERFAYAFNCTGPLHAIEHTKDPLLRSLLDAGAIRPDRLGIGLDVYWEIIAVPDIREQAAAVADDIERELGA
jgi:uncharacterized NAD(P)/FAD-binding protein YdhS